MSEASKVQYVNTSAATVKMTACVPFEFASGSMSESDSADEGNVNEEQDQLDNCVKANNCNNDKQQSCSNYKVNDNETPVTENGRFNSDSRSSEDFRTGESNRSRSKASCDNSQSTQVTMASSSPNIHKHYQGHQNTHEWNVDSCDRSGDQEIKTPSPQRIINDNNVLTHKNKGTILSNQLRVNPFNHDLCVDEDHFSDSLENYFQTERRSTGSNKSSTPEWWHQGIGTEVSFAELGLSEDHFSHPQGHFGLSDKEELELAIDNCKEMISNAAHGSDKQKNLVLKLVQLRIKLHEIKEGPEPVPENVKVILSHKMILKSSRTSKYYCERCNYSIWGMIQAWYRCTECGYRSHEKCLQQILRTCAKAKVLENPSLVTEICPKEPTGLVSQNFRCSECQAAISYSGQSEARLCDYTGRYYCELCHWNDTCTIPARVLHNWDFTGHRVCRASKQFLKLMQKKAVIRIQDINPMLFVYVDQLNEIKKLREEMMIMKKYILACPGAMSQKLLLLLERRQHFVDCSDRYSMQDLLDAEDVMLPELVSVHSAWAQHIKVDCELCQGRGFFCELCEEKDVLFPFDSITVVCAKCSNVLHRHCFAKKCICPRCERRGCRKEASQ